jgi:dipeptidyl aminopeptidase/acylaminoacyl peptidase
VTAPARRPAGRSTGPLAGRSPIAPLLALGGLVIVALVSVGLMNGRLPLIGGGGGGTGNGGPQRTAAPSNVVVPESHAGDVPGTFVYAKAGSVWIQSGKDVRQLTTGGTDINPRFSPDGKDVYFIRTKMTRAKAPLDNGITTVTLAVPLLMRIPTDGSGEAEQLATGEYTFGTGGQYGWFYWLRQPTPSPDGKTLALVSDAPNPRQNGRDVVLQTFDLATARLTVANAPESAPLGHQDPAWRPDGKYIAYTRNARDAGTSRGAPSIWRYDPKARRAAAMTGAGYEGPSWSPDGRYLAATKTSTQGTDVVILDAGTGAELLRITNDDRSFSPAWSPNGDAVAYFHQENGIVDLKVARLDGSAPTWTIRDTIDMTTVSGLDGASRPDWFIPLDKRAPVGSGASPTPPTVSGPPPSEIP